MANSLRRNKPLAKLPPAPEYRINLKSFKFWRNSFLIYWVFSFIGHLMEYVWLFTLWQFGAPPDWQNIPFFVVAAPYGLGALAIVWFIYPQIQKHKLKVFDGFVLSTIVTTVIEFLCALLIVIVLGDNPYWDYSDQPFNLFGFVCLRNSIAFGLASILFIYIAFPYTDKIMKKLGDFRLNIAFWMLLIAYTAVQIGRFFYGDAAIG
jgi:uncharacterized membrane protein